MRSALSAVAAIVALTASLPALAVTATWTGRQEMVQTVTYQTAWRCEYQYAGQRFWKVFKKPCPSSIEVE